MGVRIRQDYADARLRTIVAALAEKPDSPAPAAFDRWADVKALYRFWDNPHVDAQDIWDAHAQATAARLAHLDGVLLIQDTTWLDFSSHKAAKGLGRCATPNQSGLFLHSTLAVSTEGVPLGVIDHRLWARPQRSPKQPPSWQLPIEDKESCRWLESLKASTKRLEPGVRCLTIADREADIFEMFALPRRPGSELLIRSDASRDRVVTLDDGSKSHLTEALATAPLLGELRVELARAPQKPPRATTMAVRACRLKIHPPVDGLRRGLEPVSVTALLAKELTPPAGEAPIVWHLLTTLPVTNIEQAERCLRFYSYRWLIERFHFVLKSGYRIEQLQLETAERLERAVATYALVAWRMLWLTYEQRVDPDQPATVAFTDEEWRSLYCFLHKTAEPPERPPTLREAVRWVARLGGFLGRKGDGEPGAKCIWRGMLKLTTIVAVWAVASQVLRGSG